MNDFLPLKRGDNIALVCTGSFCETKDDPVNCADYLKKKYDLNSRYACDTYLALSPKSRAEIFYSYLRDKTIKAIWSLRGGEGSADIIPYLEARAHEIRKLSPKLLLGFSDFTALLVYFRERFAWPTLHSISARQMHRGMIDNRSEKATIDLLLGYEKSFKISKLNPLNQAAFCSRIIAREVIGGNLSLLHISLKDIWELNPHNKILLIEEVNEKPYRINRTLKHLNRIGFFNYASAVLFAGCDFPELALDAKKLMARSMQLILSSFAREINAPVLFTDSVGHGDKNHPIPFYSAATLTLGLAPELVFNLR